MINKIISSEAVEQRIRASYAAQMNINFTKMHGLGNDFMVIDAITRPMNLSTAQIRAWADRHTGVGFDQLLLVESPQSSQAEFRYRIFNADGGEVEQCGNGARCFAVFVREQGLTTNTRIAVETAGGFILLQVEDNGDITVDMGVPDFSPQSLPFVPDNTLTTQSLPQENPVPRDEITVNNERYAIDTVSMGNPHAVLQVVDAGSAEVENIGHAIGSDPHFPQGVNVGFMQCINRQLIQLRVYERGAGETQACGTGACAAVAVGIKRGLLDNEVKVQLHGGTLTIRWEGEGRSLFMTGPVSSVYKGQIADD